MLISAVNFCCSFLVFYLFKRQRCHLVGVQCTLYRLKVDELTEQGAACSRLNSEEEYSKRLELAMAEIRSQAQDREQQNEMQYTEKLTAMRQEMTDVKNELQERLSATDSLCEKLRVEKQTAIAELEERHRLRLLSIAESQEEQVCYYCVQCGLLLHVGCPVGCMHIFG